MMLPLDWLGRGGDQPSPSGALSVASTLAPVAFHASTL